VAVKRSACFTLAESSVPGADKSFLGLSGAAMAIGSGRDWRSRRDPGLRRLARRQNRTAPSDAVSNKEYAMAVEILLPRIGFSMQEGQVAEWLAKDGDQVTEGQPLFALEADKSTNEVEAPATGTLRIVAATGETYEVGTVLGYIE